MLERSDRPLRVANCYGDARDRINHSGWEALRALRFAAREHASVRGSVTNGQWLELLDDGFVNGEGFPTTLGRDVAGILAG